MQTYIKKNELERIPFSAASNSQTVEEINPNGQTVNTLYFAVDLNALKAKYPEHTNLYQILDIPKSEIVICGTKGEIKD